LQISVAFVYRLEGFGNEASGALPVRVDTASIETMSTEPADIMQTASPANSWKFKYLRETCA
jgi:hypothetical protein